MSIYKDPRHGAQSGRYRTERAVKEGQVIPHDDPNWNRPTVVVEEIADEAVWDVEVGTLHAVHRPMRQTHAGES